MGRRDIGLSTSSQTNQPTTTSKPGAPASGGKTTLAGGTKISGAERLGTDIDKELGGSGETGAAIGQTIHEIGQAVVNIFTGFAKGGI